MVYNMISLIELLNRYLWGILLILILAVGIYLSIRSKFIQLRLLPTAIRLFFCGLKSNETEESVSSHKALCTALAATVGTGNLAGVAGAIAIGGPGAVFWMWISGLMGMIIKFAEVVIALHFRYRNNQREWVGGPMQNIRRGMPSCFHILAYLYAFFGIIATFGVGNATQVNTIIGSLNSLGNILNYRQAIFENMMIGILLGIFVVYVFYFGVQKIGNYAQILVPVAAACYILLALGVLVINASAIPHAFKSIIVGAFRPEAVTGGIVGSIFQAMRIGVSRGIFTNEAGMGTASIAHASAEVTNPVMQGLLGIVEVFLDTIVICTFTALVIICSNQHIPYGVDSGIQMTLNAFSLTYDTWVLIPLTLIICLLAIATILGWGLYGARCAQFLFGDRAWKYFTLLQGAIVVLAAVADTSIVWTLAEITNGLMAVPNLISLLYLSPTFFAEIKTYRSM